MAKIRWENDEVELAEDWRIGELIEAETELGIDMNTAKGAAQMALVVYISIRRAKPDIPKSLLSDQVMRMELTALAAAEDEVPGEDPLDADGAGESPEPR